MGLAAALPAAAQPSGSTNDDVSMNIALTGEIDSLNPFIGVLADAMNIHRTQYEPMVAWGAEDNSETAAIAESWEANEDGSEWTFQLAEGDKWSDGEDINAEDVVFTYRSMLDNDALQTAYGAYLSGVESVEAVDEETVKIVMEEPQASNPGADIPIVPEHIWSAIDEPADHPNDSDVVGSGPFTVESAETTGGLVMKANPNYRHGAPAIGTINWATFRNTDAGVQALRSGEVDLISGVTAAQYETLQNESNIEALAAEGRGFRGLQINPGATDINGEPMGDGNEALKDVKVRQAIVHALDRDTLNERVLSGYGTVGTGLIPPQYPKTFVEPGTEGLLEFDLDRAKELLDEAGYTEGPDGVRQDADGNPLELRLESYDHASAQQTLDFIASWLDEIGVSTTTSINSMAQYNDDTVMGTYDLYVSGWTVRPDADYLFAMNTCDSRPNADGSGATSLANTCNEEFDELYAQQTVETDPEARAELLKQMQLVAEQDAVFPVFFYPQVFQAYRSDRFDNFVRQPAENGSILGQNGAWSLASARPAGSESSQGEQNQEEGNNSTWIWIVGGLAVLAAIVAAIVLSRKRSTATADERE